MLGEKHPNFASSLNNLGLMYSAQGNHAKAEPLQLQALGLRKEVLGQKHPKYALSLHNLATLYLAEGNCAKAESFLLRVRDIRKEVLEASSTIISRP